MSETWQNMKDWAMVVPPNRPDVWQLSAIEKRIKQYDRNDAVAILGATPEFGDLLVKMGFKKIYYFEKNKPFYRLCQVLRAHPSSHETVIWGDWMETLKECSENFTVILSDFTTGNIPYEHRILFVDSISGMLKADGIFIDRILTHPIPHEKISSLVDKYKHYPVNLITVNYFSSEFLFSSELLSLNNTVDSSLFYQILHENYASSHIGRFLEYAPLITPKDFIWWYGMPWNDVRKPFDDYFVTETIINEPETSPYKERGKLIFWKNKN